MEDERDRTGNGWDEWKRFVLGDLQRISEYTKETRDTMDKFCDDSRIESNKNYQNILALISALEIRLLKEINLVDSRIALSNEKIVALQVKAGVWGILGGAATLIIALGVWFIEKLISGDLSGA